MSVTKVPTMHPEHHPHDALYLDKHGADGVHIGVNGDRRIFEAGVIVNRADFIAAVETECDGIFIPRAELPEVVETADLYEVGGSSWPKKMARTLTVGIRQDALANLAMAEYLDAHPPVDEARVHELAMALVSDPAIVGHRATFATDAIARRLVEQGWSK